MASSKTRMIQACASVAVLTGVAVSAACPAFAQGSPSNVFEVYHDKAGRAYILSNDGGLFTPHAIYIAGMSGVRDLGNNQVQLPFNNGYGHP